MEITPDDLPDSWYEDQGVKLEDTIQVLFSASNEPDVILFTRQSKYPMAMVRDLAPEVFLVIGGKTKGIFKTDVLLLLQDKNGRFLNFKMPLNTIVRQVSNETHLHKFFTFVEITAPLLKMMTPDFIYARGLRLPPKKI
jgi:hypothetical protein